MKTQIKYFDDYNSNALQEMNEFMQNKEIIDVKMNTVVSPAGPFFNSYLIIYKDSN